MPRSVQRVATRSRGDPPPSGDPPSSGDPPPTSDSDSFRLALPEPGGTNSSLNRHHMELATSALSDRLKPVVRPCHLVLGDSIFSQPLPLSSLVSEQYRALASMDDPITAELLIERDEIKIEPEELEFVDFDNLSESLADFGAAPQAAEYPERPVRDTKIPPYDCGDDSPDYHPSMDSSGGARRRSGRPRVPTWRVLMSRECESVGRGGRRGRGRPPSSSSSIASQSRGRGRGKGVGSGAALAVSTETTNVITATTTTATTAATATANKTSADIPILTIAEKDISVKLLSGRLAIQALYDTSAKPVELSEQELTFMQLVQVKDNISRLITNLSTGAAACEGGSSAGAGSDAELMQRVRAARSLALSWIEARLRADPSLKTAGSSAPSADTGSGDAQQEDLHQEEQEESVDENVAAADNSTMPADENDSAPVLASGNEKKSAARHVDTVDKRSFKNVQDLAALQTKLHDITAVENELRRAVEFFGVECDKDETRLKRLNSELSLLRQRCKILDNHLEKNRHKATYILLDKARRRQLTADDAPVQACADLLTEVGHEMYVELLSLPLPLLTPKELQDRSRGKNTPWLDRRLLRAASRSVKHQKRVNSGAIAASTAHTVQSTNMTHEPQHVPQASQVCQLISPGANRQQQQQQQMTSTDDRVTQDVSEEVSSYIESAGDVGGSDQITLPPEVLEQVMQGKGYLVDENGERLEIRVLPDGNVIAGAQNVA